MSRFRQPGDELRLEVVNEQEVLGKQFRIYGDFENPLFLARDVAEWIDYDASSVNKMVNSVDEDEKLSGTIFRAGQNREATFLTENGVYEVLMQSRKPIAKQFKKEVKNILKSIRKHGGYLTANKIEEVLSDPDTIIKLATTLKEERLARQQLELVTKQQAQIIGELKPKADYTDRILQNKGLVTITQIAKDYGMSGQAMNEILHDLKVQYKQGKQWLLYSKYQAKGYTHSETINIKRADGTPDVTMNTKWTQKGRLFLYELLKSEGILPMIEQEIMVG